jgi:hypothetical protein
MVTWIAAATAFLFAHAPLFAQHVLLLLPVLALTAAANVVWLLALFTERRCILIVCLTCLGIAATIAGLVKREQEFLREGAADADAQRDHEVIRLIGERTRPSDIVVSDQPMQVYLAGRRTAPQLCDPSFVRIRSGYLRSEEAIRASQGARMVIFSTGRLAQLPQYEQWVQSRYELIRRFDDGSSIYLRGEMGDSLPP